MFNNLKIKSLLLSFLLLIEVKPFFKIDSMDDRFSVWNWFDYNYGKKNQNLLQIIK